jgi:hypothetical protein
MVSMPFCTPDQFTHINNFVNQQSASTQNLRHLGRDVHYHIVSMSFQPTFDDYSIGFAVKGVSPVTAFYISSSHGNSDLWILYEHLVLEKGLSPAGALDLELRQVDAGKMREYLACRRDYFDRLIAVAGNPGFFKQDPAPLLQARQSLENRYAALAREGQASTEPNVGAPCQPAPEKPKQPAF